MTSSNGDIISTFQQKALYICVHTVICYIYRKIHISWRVLQHKINWRSHWCYQWHIEGEVFQTSPPPPKFRRPTKIMPNSTQLWKLLKIAEFRTPTPQDVRKRGSKILKLPPVHNCFTLAMTNKLVVIINSLKGPKIKKILQYEMDFVVPNYSCLQNPWLGGYCPHIPVLSVICPQLNLLNPPPGERNSWVCHWMLLWVG